MRILILEDNLERIKVFNEIFKNQEMCIVDNAGAAEVALGTREFDVIFLDHDLGGQIWVDSNEENTGYQVVKYMIENQLQMDALCYIHSMNPIGANRMLNLLKDNGRDAIWIPFPQLIKGIKI